MQEAEIAYAEPWSKLGSEGGRAVVQFPLLDEDPLDWGDFLPSQHKGRHWMVADVEWEVISWMVEQA
jgi:hypothetical protein